MKKLLTSFAVPLFGIASLFMVSCDKSSGGGPSKNVDPGNPNEIAEVLVIPGSTTQQGNMPAPSGTPESPAIQMVDTTVAYSAGGQVKLPINYNDNSGSVSGIYAQVVGSDQYFQIPASGAGSAGTLVLPIGIPANVAKGKFCVTISVFDAQGNVSNRYTTCVTVTETFKCGVQRVSGGEGITSTIHNMGSKGGIVKIEYETYTVPDRIDVFYDGQWVAGTGSSPGPAGSVPPLANCSNPTDGYVGDNGEFVFPFSPTEAGANVEVVVSGCVRGGTAWKYNISCAEEINPTAGDGTFKIGSFSATAGMVVCIESGDNYQISGVTSDGSSQVSVLLPAKPTAAGTYSVIQWGETISAGQAQVLAMDGRVQMSPIQYWSTGGGQISVTMVGGKPKVNFTNVPVEHSIDGTPQTVSGSFKCTM